MYAAVTFFAKVLGNELLMICIGRKGNVAYSLVGMVEGIKCLF